MPEPTSPPDPTTPPEPTTSPEPTSPPAPDASYEGVSFSYDDAIAAGVVGETAPPEEFMGDFVIPAHTLFSFVSYALPDTFHDPRIYVYSVADLQAAGDWMPDFIADQQQVLAERPDPSAFPGIPILPPFNAAAMTRAQVAYLDFQNGSGVRFVTQYGQAFYPISNHDLFYTFQGYTNDGAYQVAAILPISHPSLPDDSSEIPGGDFEAFAENFQTYSEEIAGQLDAQPPASFVPDLSLLDAMIQSLLVQ